MTGSRHLLLSSLRGFAFFLAAATVVADAQLAAADPSGWLGVRAGIGMGDSLVLDTGADSFTSATPPALSIGITGFLSLGLVEIGACFELSSAAGTPAVGINERLFSQLRAVGLLRWHFVYDTWGGAFMGIGAGLSATRLSDFVRFEIARSGGGDPDSVERSPLGLAIEAELGTVFTIGEGLRMGVVLGVHTTADTLLIQGSSRQYFTTQGQIHVGLEWAL